jgi:hypothetical protein
MFRGDLVRAGKIDYSFSRQQSGKFRPYEDR